MCLILYVATVDSIPLRSSPELTIEEVDAGAEPVKEWLSLPGLRFVGAHTGCSCGFPHIVAEEAMDYWDGMFDLHSEDERAKDLKSAQALLTRIREHAAAGEVQMYPVWEGDQHLPPKGTIELRADELPDASAFFLIERFLYKVRRDA